MRLSELLKTAVDNEATDLYLIPKSPPMMRIIEELVPVVETPLTTTEVQQVADFMTSETQKAEFDLKSELNFAYEREGAGRFRINLYKSRSGISMVCRIV